MEHTDWIHQGFDAGQPRLLMVTAITHRRFSAPVWEEREVRKLHGELTEIKVAAARIVAPRQRDGASSGDPQGQQVAITTHMHQAFTSLPKPHRTSGH
jgi:hypothetical protein